MFASTGSCKAGTIDQSRRRHGNPVNQGAVSTFFDRRHCVQARRSLNLGLRVSF